MFIGAPARYVIHSVRSKTLGEVAAATSTQRLSLIAGKYVGKDDPVMIVRCQSGLPAVGEVLEPFAFSYAYREMDGFTPFAARARGGPWTGVLSAAIVARAALLALLAGRLLRRPGQAAGEDR